MLYGIYVSGIVSAIMGWVFGFQCGRSHMLSRLSDNYREMIAVAERLKREQEEFAGLNQRLETFVRSIKENSRERSTPDKENGANAHRLN